MKSVFLLLGCIVCMHMLHGCGDSVSEAAIPADDTRRQQAFLTNEQEEFSLMKLYVQVNGQRFSVALENNATVMALVKRLREEPLTITMNDYADFEKVGALGMTLPTDDRQMTVQPGDMVLYNGNQLVLFYGVHVWSYTYLGSVDDRSGWTEALGDEAATVTLYLQEGKEGGS